MSELVIEISGGGQVASLHMDAFDLGFLGDKRIRRQTDIVFDDSCSQQWEIRYLVDGAAVPGTRSLSGFDTYEDARSFEVKWLNLCRLNGVDPTSEEGQAYADNLRE